MNDPTLPLTGWSSVRGKSVVARFDGGMLSSNSGVSLWPRWKAAAAG
ncbi:transposase [Mesorhizobium sp. M0955]